MNIYPIKLSPVPKNIIWGGTKLRDLYKKAAPFDKIAESWELTVRGDGMSVIENGEYSTLTLGEYIERFPSSVGCAADGNFPLLIKFIDACDDLSIQVHPDDGYAALNDGEDGKTEMWYVVDAEPDAALVYGLSDGYDAQTFASLLEDGCAAQALNKLKIHAGEVYFIPAGQIHAICRGAFIAEIQQNSNTTYRIYDYDRQDGDGKKRELHISKALDVIKCYTDTEINGLRFAGRDGRRPLLTECEVLCDCVYFRVSKKKSSSPVIFTVDESSFVSLLFTHADGAFVKCGGVSVEVNSGDSIFIPAGADTVEIFGKAEYLISEL